MLFTTPSVVRNLRDGLDRLPLLGRIDRVLSVSAQLVSLEEIRDALLEPPVRRAGGGRRRPRPAHQRVGDRLRGLRRPGGRRSGLADDLRAHVVERLGGLARPRAAVFVEALPAEVEPARLRAALKVLCAADSDRQWTVSARQLRGALASLDAG